MSDAQTLFGNGGGSGVFVGGYTAGSSALPDIVIDGITVHVKTGVLVLSAAYPNAPSVAVGAGSKWVTGNPLPSSAINAQYVSIANGAYRVVYPQLDYADYSLNQYYWSGDGGATLALASVPITGSNFNIRDVCAGGGYFFMLGRNNATGNVQVFRSPDGTAGSWASIYSVSETLVSDPRFGICYGAGKLFVSGSQSGNILIIGSLNPTATTPTFTNYGNTISAAIGNSYYVTKIRYGKPGGAADTDKFFVVSGASGNSFYAYTATPETPTSWQKSPNTIDYTDSANGFARSGTVQGSGYVWAIRPSITKAFLMTNLSTGVSALTITNTAPNPLIASYDSGLFVMGVSIDASNGNIKVYDATGALLTTTSPAPLLGATSAAGASVYNGNIYLYPASGTVTARALAAGNYTNTEKALYGPAYNAAGAFQTDSRLFMRVA